MSIQKEMCDVLKEAYKRGWISIRDGNISHKIGKTLYITPSGLKKNELSEEDILVLDKSGKRLDSSNRKPSGELEMHLALQKRSKEDLSVLHLHPTHIIAAIYAGIDLQTLSKDFPEIHRYTVVGPTVPILPAISKELARATDKCFGKDNKGKPLYNIIGQSNHGICAIGSTPWDAFEHVERLNHICEIALLAKNKA